MKKQEISGAAQEKNQSSEQQKSTGKLSALILKIRSAIGDASKTSDAAEKEREIQLERITDPDDPRIEGAQDLMVNKIKFKPSEIDDIDITREAIADGSYIFTVGTDVKTNEVVALASGAALPLLDANGKDAGKESFLCGCYIAIDPPLQGQGLGKNFFRARLEDAQRAAKENGREFVGYLAEGSEREEFFNKVYAKRIYIKTGENQYEEVLYYQPPVQWNDEGEGIVEDDEGNTFRFERYSAGEHLVFAPPPGKEMDSLPATQVMNMVRGMFNYNSRLNYEGESETGRAKCNECVDSYEMELAGFLARSVDGQVYLFSGEQRKQLEESGIKVVSHKDAK